ncbi:MAG: 1-phosphofructokinase family hexose kinase [Methylomicrobium sp.]|nr:1-phosphofructokinase family hexose kinase [Methylomicrobium sp.]
MMARIFTITANTAIDHVIEVEHLGQSDNLQARSSIEFAAGKGVNVAKTLDSLGCPVTALGFVGQDSLNLFKQLDSQYLKTRFIEVSGRTRTNLTLIDTANQKELHIRTPGYCVTPEDQEKLIQQIKSLIHKDDIVLLSGSLPPGTSDDFYRQLIELCHLKSAITLLDTSGAALQHGIAAQPYLIKPNRHELAELANRPLMTETDYLSAARSVIDQGVQWVVVSRGSKGIIAISRTTATAIRLQPSPSTPLCSVGCGDTLLAGIAYAMLNQYDPLETFCYGVACATANLTNIEPGRIDKEAVLHHLNRLTIDQLKPS